MANEQSEWGSLNPLKEMRESRPLATVKKAPTQKTFCQASDSKSSVRGWFSLPSFLLPPKEMRPGAWGRSAPNTWLCREIPNLTNFSPAYSITIELRRARNCLSWAFGDVADFNRGTFSIDFILYWRISMRLLSEFSPSLLKRVPKGRVILSLK